MSNSIYAKLSLIQNEMNVPKNLFNKFGNYYYRNAETILDVAKPICHKHGLTLIVTDSIENIGDRFYVKAEAVLTDWETKESISNAAFAREESEKKGMDSSQVTGSCSSYARKYALNGLFCLDDVKDADTDEQHNEIQNRYMITDSQIRYIGKLYTKEEISAMLQRMNKQSMAEVTGDEASKMIAARKDK